MTHGEQILNYLKTHGGSATLGELLDAGRYSFGHKLTARISDLRKQGHTIICEEGPNPSQNIYRLTEKQPENQYQVEETGQIRWAI